jgi:hypothetical protein
LQEKTGIRELLDAELSRRSFIRNALIAGGGMAAMGTTAFGADDGGAALAGMRKVSPERIEPILSFHGEIFPDNPNRMFREGRFPAAPDPDREVEVVIVGGGAGGLTAAYRLRDRGFLLLEALSKRCRSSVGIRCTSSGRACPSRWAVSTSECATPGPLRPGISATS